VSNVTFDLFLSMVASFRATIKDQTELGIAFRLMDKSHDGVLTLDDLRKVVRELDEKFTDYDLREMLEEADSTSTGKVTFADFEKMMRAPKAKVK
jgi:Ca2+-binding EF-hand superfamily protein